jgi:hypothetical protein
MLAGRFDTLAGDPVVEQDVAALKLQVRQQERQAAFALRLGQDALDDVGKVVAADAFGAGADQVHFGIEHQPFVQHQRAPQQRGCRSIQDQGLDGDGGRAPVRFVQREIGHRQFQNEGIETDRADVGFAPQLRLHLFDRDFLDEVGQRQPARAGQHQPGGDDQRAPAQQPAQPRALRQCVGNPGLDGHDGRSWRRCNLRSARSCIDIVLGDSTALSCRRKARDVNGASVANYS